MLIHKLGLLLLAFPILVSSESFLGEDCLSWQYGKGEGTAVENAGKTESMAQCIFRVKEKFPEANGAFVNNPSKAAKGQKQFDCKAVVGQTGSDGDEKFISCFIQPASKKDYGSECKVAFEQSDANIVDGNTYDLGRVKSMKMCINRAQSQKPFANAVVITSKGDAYTCKAVTGAVGGKGGYALSTTCLIDADPFIPNNGRYCSAYNVGKGDGQVQKLGTVKDMASCIELVQAIDSKSNGATISNPLEANGPLECFAHLGQKKIDGNNKYVNCFLEPPSENDMEYGEDCVIFRKGQGAGGTAVKLDPAYSMKDCIRQTLIRVPYANGVTFSEVSTLTGKGDCEARIGQIYHSDSANKMNCFINPSYYKPDFGPLCKYFQRGDGVGGKENKLGLVNSMQECLQLSKQVDPTANGVTMTDPDGNPPPYECSQRVGQFYVNLNNRNKFINCFTDSIDFMDTIKNVTYSRECKLLYPGEMLWQKYKRRLPDVQNMDECIRYARQYEPNSNAVQMRNPKTYYGPYECWAGYEAMKIHTAVSSMDAWVSCFIDPKPELTQLKKPYNCKYLQYGEGKGKKNYVVGHAKTLEDCIDLVKLKAPYATGASLNKLDDMPDKTRTLWHDMFECVATIEQDYVRLDSNWENCFIEPVKENGRDNGDDCLVFTDKATGRGSSTVVGTVVDMKQCVAMVKREFPEARGASMDHPLLDLPEFNCYAHLDHMDNIYSNAKYTVCWLTSPLSTKYTYSSCKVAVWGQPTGSANHYIDKATDMNHCVRMVQASKHANTINAIYILSPETYPNRAGGYECYARDRSTGSANPNDKNWIGCYFEQEMDPSRPKQLEKIPGVRYARFGWIQGATQTQSIGEVRNISECIYKARRLAGEPANAIHMDNPLIPQDTYSCWASSRTTGVRYFEQTWVSLFIDPVKYWPEEEQGDCFYRINGAAHGAAQIHVGSVDTVKECVDLVKEKDENAEAAMVGNAWGASGQMPCYSERKFQGASANNYYMICYFPRTPKQPVKGKECMYYTTGFSYGSQKVIGLVDSMKECIELTRKDVMGQGKVANAVTMENPLTKPVGPYKCWRLSNSYGVSNLNDAYATCMLQEEPEPIPWLSSLCKYYIVGSSYAASGRPYVDAVQDFGECYDSVTSKYPLANGLMLLNPEYYPTSASFQCYAAINMLGTSDASVSWVSCFIDANDEGVLAPGADCGYFTEDGNGNGQEKNVGIVSSMSACIRLVRREVPQANGATMYSTGKGDASYNCIAETGQTGVTSQQEYFNCFIDKTKSYGVDHEDEFGPFGSRCNYFVYGSSPSTANIEKVENARNMEHCISNARAAYPQSVMAQFEVPQRSSNPSASDFECYAVISGASPNGNNKWASCYLTDEETNEATDGLGSQCVFLQEGNGNGAKTRVGTTKKMADCIDLVKYSGIAANGATLGAADSSGRRDCFAEVGQTGVKISGDFYNCFIRQQNGEDKGHEDDIKVVDKDDPVIDSNKWYYEEYPSGEEGPAGEAGFWRLPKGVDASAAVKRAVDTFYFDKSGGYWRQKPGTAPLIVPGWSDDYDGVMQVPSDKSCAVLDPDQWEFRNGAWKTKQGVILKQSTKDAECIQYVDGNPGYWTVDKDADPPTFVPGSADFEKDDDDKTPYYLIDEDKNLVIYEDDFYFDGEDWRLKPGVLPNNLDSDDFEFYEYPNGEVGENGQTGYWRPKPGKNPIVIPDEDGDDDDDDDGGDIINQSGENKEDQVVDIPVKCDEDPMSKNLAKIEISSCKDSGTKNKARSCERMYDDNLSRVVKNGGCYVSSGWSKVWAELNLASTADVFQVTLSGKANGEKLPGTKIYVCSNENDDSCVYCTTIGQTEKESCSRLGCEAVITGNRVKLVGEENGIVICDVSVMGIKRAVQPGVQPSSCSSDSSSGGSSETNQPETGEGGTDEEEEEVATAGPLSVQSCTASKQKKNNMKCEKMYDGSAKSCYSSKASKKVSGQLMLEATSEVHSVTIVGPKNGKGMKNIQVSVCSASGACTECGKFPDNIASSTVECSQPITGTIVKLENANKRLTICDVVVTGIKQSGSGGGSVEVVEVGISEEELAAKYAPKMCQDSTELGNMKVSSCSDSGTKDESRACDNMYDTSIDTADGCFITKGSYKTWTELKLESTGTVSGFSLLGRPSGTKLGGMKVSVCYQGACSPCLTIPGFFSGSCATFACESPVGGDTLRIESDNDQLFICDLKVHGEAGEISIAPNVNKPEIAISSCADSGSSGTSTSCQNMFDGDESRSIDTGACYASKGSYKIWSEIYLQKASSVSEVYLLSRSSGSNLEGVVVDVCFDDSKNCETCGTVKDVAPNYSRVSCGKKIQGNMVRLTNPGNRIIVCEIKIY